MSERPVLVFDVNETLLDLESLAPIFARIFGDGAAMREWFAQLVLYSQSLTIAGVGSDFASLAGGVLQMLGDIRGVAIGDDDLAELRHGIGHMPAHDDAADALSLLRDRGFRMVTLTNSPPSDGPDGLTRAGLADYFEERFSVQPTGRFKPAPETYRMVAERLGCKVQDMCLVACHTWDTLGLQALGGHGALVTHGANAPLPAPGVPQPVLCTTTLTQMAEAIADRWPD
ncbi:haloacid dehalogenase type II [Paracoccus sp. 1_MG-2023]|uniref:haloacid dehalogenase type II n=1 Tax=unclassified Paracoccus (in: a-proteobacteria) TaxID=2688777 RepID=UPI001C090CC4|nr:MULTISPECIES: haloacid dehalogenase type II [unclassified Paracoccus (in: a-proteobacteria)]MBU2956093.1 haloacid dehalogenase type II [Paracoccus sp. C2R09]MDO6669499.1 haloacid dehalogenase type II [Paracoccus sp. 1_MG-2023]